MLGLGGSIPQVAVRGGGGGAAPFTPLSLYASGEEGAWYDPSDLSTMFQNSNGTTAVAVGDPVGYIADKSGNGHHATQSTAAARPTLRQTAGGEYYLEFDGVDDILNSSSIAGLAAPYFLCAGLQGQDFLGITSHRVAFGHRDAGQNFTGFGLRFSNTDYTESAMWARAIGGEISEIEGTPRAWNDLAAHIASGGFQDGVVFIRHDGSTQNSAARSSTASYTAQLQVGMGNNVALNFYGGIYTIADGVSSTLQENAEAWMADKAGVTLA